MAQRSRKAGTRTHGECRQCARTCDKLVDPAGCVELDCPYLYSYDDRWEGRRFMGCLYKVFAVDIDVELFEQARATAPGYGGIKMTGEPLPHCPFTVEQAYDHHEPCVNPRFFDCTETGRLGLRVFDLRDALAEPEPEAEA